MNLSNETCLRILQRTSQLNTTTALLLDPHFEWECSSAEDVAAKLSALEDAKDLHHIYDVKMTSREAADERNPETGRMGKWTILLWHDGFIAF
jgi:hypothetical protein